MELIEQEINIDTLVDVMMASDKRIILEETEEWIDGMYIRNLPIPAGTLVVGHIHTKNSINILTKGSMLIRSSESTEWTRIDAPFRTITPPGTQKIVHTLTDCEFMNIIRTDKTTSSETYKDIVIPDKRYYKYKVLESHNSYNKFLSDNNLTEDLVQEHVQRDNVELLYTDKVEIKESIIHGLGAFTKCDIEAGSFIGYSLIDSKRSELGRYVNHAHIPNIEVRIVTLGDKIEVYAKHNITKGTELLLDYNNALRGQEELICQ